MRLLRRTRLLASKELILNAARAFQPLLTAYRSSSAITTIRSTSPCVDGFELPSRAVSCMDDREDASFRWQIRRSGWKWQSTLLSRRLRTASRNKRFSSASYRPSVLSNFLFGTGSRGFVFQALDFGTHCDQDKFREFTSHQISVCQFLQNFVLG